MNGTCPPIQAGSTSPQLWEVHSVGRAAAEGLGAGSEGQQGCIANKVPQTRWRRAPLHTKALDSQGSLASSTDTGPAL